MIVTILTTVFIFIIITALLALFLVIAEYFFANYGECEITINDEKKLNIEGGSTLLNTLKNEKIFIPSACGGRGTCGYCKVKIQDGAGPLLPTEEPLLAPEEIQSNTRLSCQVKVKRNMKIEIPEELFNIKRFIGKVSEIKDLTYDIKRLHIELSEPDTINFKAGQYIQLESKPYGEVKESVSRAYSISSPHYDKDYVEVMIRLVPDGICTTWVHNYLKEGDDVSFIGPMGDFYMREDESDIIFIAGGSGMAPIYSLLKEMEKKQNPRKAHYFFGARTKMDLFYSEEIQKLTETIPDFTYVPSLSRPDENDEWDGETGLITIVLENYLKTVTDKKHQAYLCGSPGMINACIAVLKKYNIAQSDIFYDPFA